MLLAENLVKDLQAIISKDRIKEEETNPHILGNSGKVNVYPVTEQEVSKILAYANEHGKSVIIEGGGTKRGFGGVEEYADILLSMAQFKGVVEHTPGDMTLTVKSGTTFKELQDYLSNYNQQLSLDPCWPEFSTIGGIVASNESGPKRIGYGSSRDAVIGLRMVYPDGTVIRSGGKVVKNVAGYDMNKLFIGAMGTLGVMTEVTVKLRPIPKYESLILLTFKEHRLEDMRQFSKELLDSPLEPVACELLSPSLSKKLTGEDSYIVAISFEDVENSVHYQEEYINKIKPSFTNLKLLAQGEAKNFWNLFYTMYPNGFEKESKTEASLKIGAVNLTVLDIIKACHHMTEYFDVLVDAHGGLGHGLASVNVKGESGAVIEAIEHIRKIVRKLGGYVVVKHLPHTLRQKIEVWGEKPTYFFLLEGIKSKIDPKKTLNPKRFVGGL